MKAWLSTFFSWAVRKKYVTVNPTREMKVKKPKKRNVYIPDEHFVAIRAAGGGRAYRLLDDRGLHQAA